VCAESGHEEGGAAPDAPPRRETAVSSAPLTLIGPDLHRPADCEAVLRSLPRWFGIEEALLMYVRDSAAMPTFAIEQAGRLRAFVTLHRHFPQAWEVHCIAVAADARGQGLGRRLMQHAEQWALAQGARFMQVKTVADTSDSLEYAETRRFYAALGYTPLEVFPTLWSPRNPALQLIKVLQPVQP
jgi:GNAT superfamily N-acetyltransferase